MHFCASFLFLFYSITFTLCKFALFLQKHLCLQKCKKCFIMKKSITFAWSFLLTFSADIDINGHFYCIIVPLLYFWTIQRKSYNWFFNLHLAICFMGRNGSCNVCVPGYKGQRTHCRKWSFPYTSWFPHVTQIAKL